MYITFFGATREVTGSMFMVVAGSDHILLDCGLFQGRRRESTEKNRVLPFDPAILSTAILSHAHIDHSGRLPLLIKKGFTGRIISTRATEAACRYLLPDSAHIQESDAAYLNYKLVRSVLSERRKSPGAKSLSRRTLEQIKKLLKKDPYELDQEAIADFIQTFHLEAVEPLYTAADAQETLGFFDGYPYRNPVTVGNGATCVFYDAGHILGSAMSLIRVCKKGKTQTLLYTGDIGRFGKPVIKDPCLCFEDQDRQIDLMVMESTYGNRVHEHIDDMKDQLRGVLLKTFERGGTVLIPAFAFGRTQTLLYMLHQIYDEKRVPRVPVFVDSPLAVNLTHVFGQHLEAYDRETHRLFLEKGVNPFEFKQMHFVSSVEESMELNRRPGPMIVISASGMCESGRILHHLRHKIHNPDNTILLVGYSAQNTLGRRIEELGLAYEENGRKGEPPVVRFLNKEYPLKARVVKIGGFSAHADKKEMLRFLKTSNLRIKHIALVHGEEEQSLPLAGILQKEGYSVFVPKLGETLQV